MMNQDLLTVPEVALYLRTSPKAIYHQIERQQLPGIVRLGRRVLVKRKDLLRFIDRNSSPSPMQE
jgi:excisionase family DNA binding protein